MLDNPALKFGLGSPITPSVGAAVGKPLASKTSLPAVSLANLPPHKTPKGWFKTAREEVPVKPFNKIEEDPPNAVTSFLFKPKFAETFHLNCVSFKIA